MSFVLGSDFITDAVAQGGSFVLNTIGRKMTFYPSFALDFTIGWWCLSLSLPFVLTFYGGWYFCPNCVPFGPQGLLLIFFKSPLSGTGSSTAKIDSTVKSILAAM